jgi:glutamate synthase domain-containing protein 2
MSFGALSGQAKEALGRGATLAGTSTTTGDGGMTPEERGHSEKLVYQYLPSRYGMNPDDLRKADAIEVVVGQGAKPGGGGMLLGQKIDDRVAEMRTLPKGIDQRSACRHPDWTGPDDLEIKILELREITGWRVPIYIKVGATRPYFDVALAVKAGADVVVIDGMQGGTAATQDVFIEHVGIPTLACIRPAVKALQDLGLHREVQLSSPAASAPARTWPRRWRWVLTRSPSGRRRWWRWATMTRNTRRSTRRSAPPPVPMTTGTRGNDPAGITTQDPELAARLDPVRAAAAAKLPERDDAGGADHRARLRHNHLHHLEPEDLCALTMEAAAMAQVPLAGTDWYPGKPGAGY